MIDRVPRGVKVLIGAIFLSRVGQAALVTIVGLQIYQITGRELDLGLLGLVQFIPVFFLSPVAGFLSDRFDRRKVYAFGLIAQMLVSLGLVMYSLSEPTSVAPAFVLMGLFGAGRALVAPSGWALPFDLSPPGVVSRVVAIRSGSFQVATIVGPIAAAVLYERNSALPYVAAAIFYVASMGALFYVPKPTTMKMSQATTPRAAIRDAFEGLRFIRRTPTVLGIMTLDLFAVLLGGAVALLPAIADERLGVGVVEFGWLRASIAIGALGMATILAVRPMRRHAGPKMLVAVFIFGLATIVLGLTTNFVVALVALAVLGAADVVSVVVRSSVTPLATPEHMRGRVLATESVFIGGSNELGAVESGLVGQWLGASLAVTTGGIGTLLIVVLWWRLFPALRGIDRVQDVVPEVVGGTQPPP